MWFSNCSCRNRSSEDSLLCAVSCRVCSHWYRISFRTGTKTLSGIYSVNRVCSLYLSATIYFTRRAYGKTPTRMWATICFVPFIAKWIIYQYQCIRYQSFYTKNKAKLHERWCKSVKIVLCSLHVTPIYSQTFLSPYGKCVLDYACVTTRSSTGISLVVVTGPR